MSVLNTSLQTLIVRQRDITGRITQQKLHSRVFDAYEAKWLVFELLTPPQQQVMMQYGGKIPAQHPVGAPSVIETWNELLQCHNEQNLYQLLPRIGKTNQAYMTMAAICNSPHSPFRMEHRIEPNEHKLIFRDKDVDARNAFNLKNAEKFTGNIFFDGIMSAPRDTALVMMYPTVSPPFVNSFVAQVQFLREWVNDVDEADRYRDMRKSYRRMLGNNTHLFMGATNPQTPPTREITGYARSRGVHLYARRGSVYSYVP